MGFISGFVCNSRRSFGSSHFPPSLTLAQLECGTKGEQASSSCSAAHIAHRSAPNPNSFRTKHIALELTDIYYRIADAFILPNRLWQVNLCVCPVISLHTQQEDRQVHTSPSIHLSMTLQPILRPCVPHLNYIRSLSVGFNL